MHVLWKSVHTLARQHPYQRHLPLRAFQDHAVVRNDGLEVLLETVVRLAGLVLQVVEVKLAKVGA